MPPGSLARDLEADPGGPQASVLPPDRRGPPISNDPILRRPSARRARPGSVVARVALRRRVLITEHDPEKVQTFRTRSCSRINEMRARCDSISSPRALAPATLTARRCGTTSAGCERQELRSLFGLGARDRHGHRLLTEDDGA